jgi:hypothetical protein
MRVERRQGGGRLKSFPKRWISLVMSHVLHTQCAFVLLAGTGCGRRQRYRSECPFATSTLTRMARFVNYMGCGASLYLYFSLTGGLPLQ